MGRGGGEGEVISDILIDNDTKPSNLQVIEVSMDNQVCACATPIQDMNCHFVLFTFADFSPTEIHLPAISCRT